MELNQIHFHMLESWVSRSCYYSERTLSPWGHRLGRAGQRAGCRLFIELSEWSAERKSVCEECAAFPASSMQESVDSELLPLLTPVGWSCWSCWSSAATVLRTKAFLVWAESLMPATVHRVFHSRPAMACLCSFQLLPFFHFSV